MKSALSVLGLVVVLCALMNSATVRQNISSWVGSCWNQTAYGDGLDQPYEPAYRAPVSYAPQQYNRNTVVNRVYAPTVYRRPVFAPVQFRPYGRSY